MYEDLIKSDPELYSLLSLETERQRNTLDLVASESVPDNISLELCSSVFGGITAVGLPGKQRMAGSGVVDELEKLAAERACRLFGAEHADILPYSGTVANICVYAGLLKPGDTVLAFDPECGSHASHGRKGHITGDIYDFVHFGVRREDQLIDYDEAERLAKEYRPKLLVAGSSSYPRLIDHKRLAEIARSAGAPYMADAAHITGLIAAGMVPNPFPYADIVTASCTKTMCGVHTGFILCKDKYAEAVDRGVYPGFLASMHPQTIAAAAWAFERASSPEFRSLMEQVILNRAALGNALEAGGLSLLTGGGDCHMLVIDLKDSDARAAVDRLYSAGIRTNTKKLTYSGYPYPTGIRLGVTAVTQRGMKEPEMTIIADLICRVISGGDTAEAKRITAEICG